jgi:hypothetical protein
MKHKNLIFCILLMFLMNGCNKKEETIPPLSQEGSIYLSDLKTKHDYYLPFSIVNNSNSISSAVLNNEAIDFKSGSLIEFKENGFYELALEYHNSKKTYDTILFTTRTSEREASEWGIRAWVPAPFITVPLGAEEVEVYYPRKYTDGIKVPFIFYVKESGSVKEVYCQGKATNPADNFNIKRGVGSVNIAASSLSDGEDFVIGGKIFSTSPLKIQDIPVELQGTISSPTDIAANSFIKISGDLNIASAGSLTIHEGTVVIIDEAVDINVSGPIIISGTSGNPVFFTCSAKDKYWGGFITRVSGGTIEAKYTIFCQSGYHDTDGYKWGHSGRQALFYTENSNLKLDHCFILDNIGQIFYPQNATLLLNEILVQRAQTGGQINTSHLTLRNSVFTDFPYDSNIFLDKDNDALYLSASDADIDSTTFMFATDDGLDSGNTEGGVINVTNCRFEACFHEGAALSSGNNAVKNHTFRNCVFTNCGQGLELGFSSPNHSVLAENCLFLKNGVGIRYGDNYDWANVEGKMHIKNSLSLDNDKDVWNMVRMDWSPKLENLTFENTLVSKFSAQYPELNVKANK